MAELLEIIGERINLGERISLERDVLLVLPQRRG